jgi:uncharacterized membrane protein YphA (DoxX/SURF4 family)
MNSNARVALSWNLLRYSYGIVILLVGLDKIFGTDFIVSWPKYISPFVLSILPVSVPVFLIAMGIIEVVVAIMLLTKWPRIAGYLSIAWLLLIAVNLLLGGYVDVAVRDILLAIGAFVSTELGLVVMQNKANA